MLWPRGQSLSFAPIEKLTQVQVADMLRAKIDGTGSALVPNGRAANRFLGFYSHLLRLPFRRLGVCSLFGSTMLFMDATAQDGELAGLSSAHGRLGRLGASARVCLLPTDSAFSAKAVFKPHAWGPSFVRVLLDGYMSGSEPQTIVARIDWNVLKPLLEAGRPRPFLSRVGLRPLADKSQDEKVQNASGPTLIERLAQGPVAARKDMLAEFVRGEAAVVLGLRTPDSSIRHAACSISGWIASWQSS